MGSIRTFLDQHFLHFNARETVAAARAYENHIQAGGKMLVTLAGAMSTAKLGQILARMIRADMVHGICCTGANLEEDLFNLLAYNDYKIIEDYRALSVEDEKELYEAGFNRVTDTAIPETVMRNLERKLIDRWKAAADAGERKFEAEFLQDIFANGAMEKFYQIPARNSWLLAAWEKGIPVYHPGWEDSTTGNMFAAAVFRGEVKHHQCVKSGTEQMEHLMRWYLDASGYNAAKKKAKGGDAVLEKPSVGLLPGGRRHRRRLRDLRRAGDGAGPPDGGCSVLGLLRADLGCVDQLRRLLRRSAQREDHLGQARRGHAQVHDPVGRDDRGAADVRLRAE